MLPQNKPDSIRILFDDHRLVANAGLHPRASGPAGTSHLDLGGAPGRANTGDKLMTLVASAMAGGDCIDDADTGGTACTLGGTVKAPSTLATFLRSFRWGHVRQLDRVSRELLARAWALGPRPGDAPFTIDLDSTICETYGLAKGGRPPPRLYRQGGYHPLLAIAAGTGDVLMSRLREGRANTARGAAHFSGDGGSAYAGANGRLTLRADSGFYTHGVVSVTASPSPSASTRACAISSRYQRMPGLLISVLDGPVPPMWLRPPALPRQSEPDAAPVRLIAGVSQRPLRLLAITVSSPTGTGRCSNWRPTIIRPSETSSTTISPRAASPPTPPGWRYAGPLDSAHRSGRQEVYQDPPAAVLLPGRTDHLLGAPPHTASATALALGSPVRSCPGPIARPATPCLTAAATGRHPANRTSPRTRASPVCECLLLRPLPAISP